MDCSRSGIKRIYGRIGLNKRNDVSFFWVAFSFLAVYFGCVAYAQIFIRDYDFGFLTVIALAVSAVACFFGVYFFGGIELKTVLRDKRSKALIFAVTVFIATFLIYYSWQRVIYPGSFSPDSIEQYKQTQLNEYNDWHPVLHTWLFFGLPNIFSDSPALLVTLQLVWFSLAITYLLYVLYTDGCPKTFIAISWAYIVLNPNTALIMLYPWKDSAFTILSTVMLAQCVRIYRSNGKWLLKWCNTVAFALFAFLANGVRHNAILLVLPTFIVIFVFLKQSRRRLLVAGSIFLILTLLLKLPIYSIAEVGSPKHRTTEVMGLPMTVLADVYMNDRDALDDEAVEFLDSLATQARWEKYYTFGSFNSFKWSDGTIYDKIDQEGAEKILSYTFSAVKNSPNVAKKSVFELTKMVWSVDGGGGWTIGYGITGNEFDIRGEYDYDGLDVINAYRKIINGFGTKYLFNYTGIIIALLLTVAVARIGKAGWSKVFSVIPLMVYNFGTMLLLTGHDFRFFHLNFVAVIPLLYIMLTNKQDADDCIVS
ncbi:MAG: hypothetical protein IIW39_02985 [Clostridia bacterium]|nr:hypothetical protein [Clostridia bacterium]